MPWTRLATRRCEFDWSLKPYADPDFAIANRSGRASRLSTLLLECNRGSGVRRTSPAPQSIFYLVLAFPQIRRRLLHDGYCDRKALQVTGEI